LLCRKYQELVYPHLACRYFQPKSPKDALTCPNLP
jgi:hypothetical protein